MRALEDGERQLVDLVKADYDATQRALAGFVTSGGQLRAVGIAAWGVVFAVALQSRSVTVSLMSVALAVAFAVADAYHGALYRQALGRARELEDLLGDYQNSLGIHAASKPKVARAMAALEQHRFGVHRNTRPVNTEAGWWLPRPIRVTWIYGALVLIASAAALWFGLGDSHECRAHDIRARTCLVLKSGSRTTPGLRPGSSARPNRTAGGAPAVLSTATTPTSTPTSAATRAGTP